MNTIWPAVVVAAAACLGMAALHFRWRRHRAALEDGQAALRRENQSLRDRQERAQAQARGHELALFNSMVEGVLLLDSDGCVRLVNRALEQLFGLTDDIRGRTMIEAFRLHELQALVQRVRVEGQVRDFEIDLPGLDRRCLEVNAAALPERDGAPGGIVLVFHDLTRMKQLENTRQEFVANVSHELRTPLSMIKGYVETLLDGAKDDPKVVTRFLQTIEKHADRLTYLIEDLLTISRLESGQIVMNVQTVELRALADDVLTDLGARAGERKVTLENQVPAGITVRADAERLQQVLFNLVDNAIKYGRPGGFVRLETRPGPDTTVEVSVSDNGPGIPADALERVFERFYRVDKARSREQGGTGLGLAIVKHIVQSHGGEVWAKSDLGQGTTFFFTLPGA